MREAVHLCADVAGNELHGDSREDIAIFRVDDLVFEIYIYTLRRHCVRVGHLVKGSPLFVRKEFENPSVQFCRVTKVAVATNQFVRIVFFYHALPESLVGFAFGCVDELGQDGCEALYPIFHAVLFQLLRLFQHLLPVFRRTCERDGRNAAGYIMHDIIEVRFHGFHQGDLRGDAFDGASGSEVGCDSLGDVLFGVFVDLFRESINEFIPFRISLQQFFLSFNHQVHLPRMAHQLIAQFLWVCVHVACESLTDEQPNHIG